MSTMTQNSITQKLCSKIGIRETELKRNSLLTSPNNKTISSTTNKQVGYSISPSKRRGTKYECFKIEMLVPNSEPPKPQIKAYNPISNNQKQEKTTKKINVKNISIDLTKANKSYALSPQSTKQKVLTTDKSFNLYGATKMDDITNAIKLGNLDMINPISKVHQRFENKTSGKFNLLILE